MMSQCALMLTYAQQEVQAVSGQFQVDAETGAGAGGAAEVLAAADMAGLSTATPIACTPLST